MTATFYVGDDCGCTDRCRIDDWSDQFQPATRELMVFTKRKDRYFDLDAVREPMNAHTLKHWESPGERKGVIDEAPRIWAYNSPPNPAGAPPLDWWLIPYTDPDVPQPPGDTQMTATFYVGDAIEVMNSLPEKSVDLVLTSPPFLALRSYLPTDHPDKALEGGSQATPGEYIDWLLDVVEACERVLAPHGSLCFELGDTYSGSGGAGGDYDADGLRTGQPRFRQGADGKWNAGSESARINGAPGGNGWPLAKSLSLIPETFRFAMVYGHNPHTGRRTAPWRLRNVIRWVRPNPPVGALGDKFRPATSELMVFCKAKDRYFDLDATREPVQHPLKSATTAFDEEGARRRKLNPYDSTQSAGAPPLDWWNIPPGGYAGAHYAVWPPELLIKPIKAMCPESVCRVCGEPRRRMVGEVAYVNNAGRPARMDMNQPRYAPGVRQFEGYGDNAAHRIAETLGFSDCSHDDWRPGLVLDPFAGSGTTLSVATGHGRDAIGIDLDERNYELALDRVGPLILELGLLPET